MDEKVTFEAQIRRAGLEFRKREGWRTRCGLHEHNLKYDNLENEEVGLGEAVDPRGHEHDVSTHQLQTQH